ncbi:MAG: hypothetical protein LBL07_03605 [Tannerella sp.]|jgi:hypothetical protein|nr:hypothetical protein [Tannerella sp.]
MGLFDFLNSKSAIEKDRIRTDKQLRKLRKEIEKNKKLLGTLEWEHHPDGTRYTKQDCVAYAFLYCVKKQYDRGGEKFDMDTAKWLLDTYCGGSDTYNGLFLLKFMMACANEGK